MPEFKISASILSADFARLGEEAQQVLAAGADEIHFDVMDNHYVPNLTIGPLVCAALRHHGITAPIDVHLMTQPVDNLISEFAKAGASSITFHPEASLHVDRSLQLIRSHGCKAGLALNPATPLSHLEHIWDKLDLILVMSVNPGFAGQEFIPSALDKIQTIRKLIEQHKKNIPMENRFSGYGTNRPKQFEFSARRARSRAAEHICTYVSSEASAQQRGKPKCDGYINLAVDGGIKEDNIAYIAKAGADTFAMGSTIFNNKKPYQETIAQLRKILAQT